MALAAQAMCEPFPEVWVIIHDENSLWTTDAHAVSPQSFSAALGASNSRPWHTTGPDLHSPGWLAFDLALVVWCVITLIFRQTSRSRSRLKAQPCSLGMNAFRVFVVA
jgi:hypothetical protein